MAAEKPIPVNESSTKKGRVSRSFKKIVQCAWLDFHLCITASICVIYWYFFCIFACGKLLSMGFITVWKLALLMLAVVPSNVVEKILRNICLVFLFHVAH